MVTVTSTNTRGQFEQSTVLTEENRELVGLQLTPQTVNRNATFL